MDFVKRLICILSLMAVCIFIHAKDKPDWTHDTGYNSLTYSYLISRSADAASPETAEALAIDKVSSEAGGYQFIIVDTYKEKLDGFWRVYVLAQISRAAGTKIAEKLTKTNTYKLIGESFVPGMAQIKKGQIAKGASFIAAEAVCIGGIIVSESQRHNFNSKMSYTRDPDLRKSYKNKADNWAMARNIFIAGTAAVYVWNVIDGLVAKGKTQIKGPNGERVAFSPYYNPSTPISPGSCGLALNITW